MAKISKNIASLTFVTPENAIKAYISNIIFDLNCTRFWLVEKDHKDLPIPENVVKITMQKDIEKGSLEFIKFYFSLLKNIKMKDFDIIIKKNADCVIYNTNNFIWPIFLNGVDLCYIKNMYFNEYTKYVDERCYGDTYAISSRAVECFNYEQELLEKLIEKYNGNEDLILTAFIKNIKFPILSQIDHQRCDLVTKRNINDTIIAGGYSNLSNTAMLNRVNKILEVQGKTAIKESDLTKYINELTTYFES
jgi:hypothetical protein